MDLEKTSHKIGYYPSIYGVDIRISGDDLEKIENLKDHIRANINEYIYEIGNQNLEEILIKKLKRTTVGFEPTIFGSRVRRFKPLSYAVFLII